MSLGFRREAAPEISKGGRLQRVNDGALQLFRWPGGEGTDNRNSTDQYNFLQSKTERLPTGRMGLLARLSFQFEMCDWGDVM